MSSIEWWKCPDDFSLSAVDGWDSLGHNRYRAIRNHFLIVQQKSNHSKVGPIILERKLPSGAEIKFERKQSIIIKHGHLISSTIQKTITTKLLAEVGAQLTSEISVLPPLGKLQNSLQAKMSSEFTEVLTAGLSETRSYEVTSTEELMSSFSLRVPDSEPNRKNTYYFYLPVWPWQWDIYLYRQEVVEFTHKRNTVFWRNREGIRSVVNDLRLPLARVIFYEPDDGPSVDSELFEPEVPDANLISILPLEEPCPTTIKPLSTSLESFLPIAFPVNKREKQLRDKIHANGSTRKKQSVGLSSEEWTALRDTRGHAAPDRKAKRTSSKRRMSKASRTRPKSSVNSQVAPVESRSAKQKKSLVGTRASKSNRTEGKRSERPTSRPKRKLVS